RTLGTRAVRRRARPVAVLVLVALGVAEIDGARAVAVEVPARRARRPRHARRPLRTRITRHALHTLRPRRALRPDRPLIALRPLRPLHALRARRAGRTLRARRTRGARRTLGTRAVRRRARPVAVLVLVTLGVGEIDGAHAVAVEIPARRALRTRRT